MNNIVALVAVEAEDAVLNLEEGASLEDRARVAMRVAKGHWLATLEEDQFLGACEGLARTSSEDERERIVEDLERLARASALLSALSSGVAVDFGVMADKEAERKEQYPPLGLKAIWQEVVAED